METKLTKDIKYFKGEEYSNNMYGIPNDYKSMEGTTDEDWYWRVGSKIDDNKFLPVWYFDMKLHPKYKNGN